MTPRISASGTRYQLARALFDYVTGLDPSAVGLVQVLLGLIPRRGSRSRARSDKSLTL